ncbi:MAG: PIN domain-containing protein [Nocardioides sp.]
MKVFIDTNIFVYQFDMGDETKRSRALDVVASTAHQIVISTQVLFEFYTAISRKLAPPLTAAEAAETTRALAAFDVVTMDADLALRSVDTAARHRLSMWDAAMVEAAASAGCEELWTEDMDTGATLRGVRIVNPLG